MKMKMIATLSAAAALLVGLCAPMPAMGQHHVRAPSMPEGWKPIDPSRLATMRGGMQLPSGLALSFGIERLVYLNDKLVASSRLQVADISQITPAQARALAEINRGMVVRVGDGNHVGANGPAGAAGLVIQNTLDGQVIRSLTTLDVGVGTLGMFQQLNAADALQNALVLAPGGP